MTPTPLKTRLFSLAACAALAVGLSACENDNVAKNADLIAGKKAFAQKCGSCHVLARAGTKGNTGPNLDAAFQNPRDQGFGEGAIRGMVREMIDIGAAGGVGGMVPDIVEGEDARDVAAYVARSVAVPGEDEGLLASAVKTPGEDGPAKAENGVLTIPADPTGQLLFVFSTAEAPAGQLEISMPNDSGVPHNIAIDGKGTSEIIEEGESSFTATFAPGEYEYICEVEGHEAAGMVGTLTVK